MGPSGKPARAAVITEGGCHSKTSFQASCGAGAARPSAPRRAAEQPGRSYEVSLWAAEQNHHSEPAQDVAWMRRVAAWMRRVAAWMRRVAA